ncbi:hypothetical protein GCM10022288_04680 [Gryllotalpicola kribbensis]|uniref:Uncharacterized protein n=1 Tax=Gryllotalpicola kribbensis TaxID=993084 RepID=A0ABP8AI12_9MICO
MRSIGVAGDRRVSMIAARPSALELSMRGSRVPRVPTSLPEMFEQTIWAIAIGSVCSPASNALRCLTS